MDLSAYWRLSRPVNIIISMLSMLLMATLMPQFPDLWKVLAVMAVVGLLNAAANAVNDITDIEIDRINRPKRPLPAGEITAENARRFSVICFTTGNLLSWTLGPVPGMISTFIATTLMILYSLRLKVLPFWGNLTIAFILGLAMIYAASAFGDPAAGITPAGLAFLINLVREIIKDLQDMEGDTKRNARTLPLYFGVAVARRTAAAVLLVLLAVIPVPYVLGIYSAWYLSIVSVAVFLPLLPLFFMLLTNKYLNYGKISSMLKLAMLFGLAAIYAGRWNA